MPKRRGFLEMVQNTRSLARLFKDKYFGQERPPGGWDEIRVSKKLGRNKDQDQKIFFCTFEFFPFQGSKIELILNKYQGRLINKNLKSCPLL